eukprot:TRINITY_DN7916_c0_g1_i9.p1 TRINITY_DN7916_c0_g1~~TRINITY_DN7916_c0_g1_i9.p1  ORF type:complete len:429 (+),score=117.17 TRINITY_DN7916_c0_g1_i9:175-1461(+)
MTTTSSTNSEDNGKDARVYSTKVPFYPLSFLRMNLSNTIPPSEAKYFPQAPPPSLLADEELYFRNFVKKEDVFEGNSVTADCSFGGVKVTDEKSVEQQHSVFATMLKKLGKSIFTSNTAGVSMPIWSLEPKTELDRAACSMMITGYYLGKAAKHPNKLERLKLVIASRVAVNYIMLRKQKSLNPLLGETIQATLVDGTDISVEQISHHPPISYIYAVGPKRSYRYYGSSASVAHFKGNHLVITSEGKTTVEFKDGQVIEVSAKPVIKITGLMMGEQRAFFKGPMVFEDKKLKVRAVIFFDYGEKKGILSNEKTALRDAIEGVIYVPKKPTFNEKVRRVADMDDVGMELARIEGSWLEKVEIGSVNYWHIDKLLPMQIVYSKNPLPSDGRYREDLIWARRNNMEKAEAWKDALEVRQRRDRAQREKFAK